MNFEGAAAKRLALGAIFIGIVLLIVGTVYLLQSQKDDSPRSAPVIAADLSGVPSGSGAAVSRLAQFRQSGQLNARFIGDSLTVGWNASSESASFRGLLTSRLDQDGPTQVSVTAQKGATTEDIARVVPSPTQAGLVIVELGTNDVGKTAAATVDIQYRALLTAQQARDSLLICLGTYQRGTTAGIDDVIRRACTDFGGTFVKIGDLRNYPNLIAQPGEPAYPDVGDGSNPNTEGHRQIATRVMTALGIAS